MSLLNIFPKTYERFLHKKGFETSAKSFGNQVP